MSQFKDIEDIEAVPKEGDSLSSKIYLGAVSVFALLAFCVALYMTPNFYQVSWRDFIVFCLLNILAEQTYVVLPRGSKLSASFSIVLASLLLFNAPIAAIMVAIGSLCTTLLQKRDWDVILFNVSQYTFSYLMAGAALAVTLPILDSLLGSYSLLNTLIGAGFATLVYMMLNIPIVNGYVALKENPGLRLTDIQSHIFYWHDELIEITQTIFFYPIAVMVAEYYRNEQNLMILGVLMALILGGLRFIEQQRRIEHQNEKMRVLYELTKDCGELILRETDIDVSDSDLFKALLKTTNHLQINKILPNHRCSVYRVEYLGEEDEDSVIVHQESNQILEPERVYHLDEEGLLQDLVVNKSGVINNNLGGLPNSYIAWRWRYSSILAQPIMLDDDVAYVLVLFREQGDNFDKNDDQMLQLLVKPLEITLKNIQLRKKIQEQAIKDGLMGIFNHRYMKTKMEEELSRSKRYKKPLAVVICDVDYFKKFNDTHGHLLGDKVLKEIAQIIQDSVRETDIVARYGGEELAILLPETSMDFACEVAERMRHNVATHEFTGKDNQIVSLSMSLGITGADDDPDLQVSEMIVRADTALYKAKNQGRNQICRSVVDHGKLIIETYSKGEAPVLPESSDAAGNKKIHAALQKSWLEGIKAQQHCITEGFDRYLDGQGDSKRILRRFLKRKVISAIPEIFELFLIQYVQGDSVSQDAFVSGPFSDFQEKVVQKLKTDEKSVAGQERVIFSYQFMLNLGLDLGRDEHDKKQVISSCFQFLELFNQQILTLSWQFLDRLYQGSQALYKNSANLHQLKIASGERDTALKNSLSLACEHLQLPGAAFLALRSPYEQSFRIQAFWSVNAKSANDLRKNQTLVIPSFHQEQDSNYLQMIETDNPSDYLSEATLDNHFFDATHLTLVPLVYQHQVYGVLAFCFPRAHSFKTNELDWLERFCRDMAMDLHLNLRLNETEQQTLNMLKQQVDILNQLVHKDSLYAERVFQLAGRIGKRKGLSDSELYQLKEMAYIHNLGELLFSSRSQKSGPVGVLTQRLLQSVPTLRGFIAPLRYYREHWDGSGLPEGLQGEQIPLYARIIGLAAAYEKQMSDPSAQAVNVLEGLFKSGHYEPHLYEILEKMVKNDDLKI